MKKVIALALAGAMIFSTPVMAKEVGAPVAKYLESSSYVGVIPETVRAIDADKTIGEHMNNAVVDIWDMDGEEVQDLAVGKGAILDGVESPALTFELYKPELKRVYAAKSLAQDKGTLLSVVKVHTVASYDTAKFSFYAPGVKAGQTITVYQRVTDDNWVAVPTEVTDDHVTVEITANEHLAFIEMAAPAVEAAPAAPAVVAAPAAPAKAETVAAPAKTEETAAVAAPAKTEKTEVVAEAAPADDAEDEAEVDADADADATETEDEEK